MLLTVEYKNTPDSDLTEGEVEIYCDQNGLDFLINKLTLLKKHGGHEHFMTQSWAGNELTEEKQGKGNSLMNALTVILKPEG